MLCLYINQPLPFLDLIYHQAHREREARAKAGPIMDGPRQRNRVNYTIDDGVRKGSKRGGARGDQSDSDFEGGNDDGLSEDESVGDLTGKGKKVKGAKKEKVEKVGERVFSVLQAYSSMFKFIPLQNAVGILDTESCLSPAPRSRGSGARATFVLWRSACLF